MQRRIATAICGAAIALTIVPAAGHAATGPAGSGVAAAAQYAPETTGTVPVPPPVQDAPSEAPPTPASEPPTAVPATAPPAEPTTAPSQEPTAAPQPTPESETPTTRPVANPAPATPAAPVATAAAAPPAGTLPFTGYDVVPIAIGGMVLLALGLALRLSRRGGRE